MIDGNVEDGFNLVCDACGECCDELFETFDEAVEYKKNKDNGWISVKDKYGDWQELGPCCKKEDVIVKLKGSETKEMPDSNISSLPALQLEFEGF